MVRLFLGGRSISIDGAQMTGEKIPGDLAGWVRYAMGSTPNDFITDTYDLISRSCLSLYHSYGPAQAVVNRTTDYVIGEGLFFASLPDYALLGWEKERALEWAKRFQRLIAYKMDRLNLYQKMNAAFRWALAAGDTVTYLIREEGQPLDIVEFPGSEIDPDYADDDVTLGIKHDKFYRRQGFYNRDGGYTEFQKDGRQQAIQFYLKKSPRQLRGWPLIYSNISLSKNNDRFDDAVLATMIQESLIALVTETENPMDTKAQIAQQAQSLKRGPVRRAIDAVSNIGNTRGMLPGQILNMEKGGKVTSIDKKTPNGAYGTFKEWSLKQFAMGASTPPGFVTGEYPTSYTSHKGSANDFWKTVLYDREEFIRIWCKPILHELAIELILEGAIEAPAFFSGGPMIQAAYLKGIWRGPVPGAINPAQEIKAKLDAVNGGVKLRGDVQFEESGTDFDEGMAEWHRQEEIFGQKTEAEVEEAIEDQDEENLENAEDPDQEPDENGKDKQGEENPA